MGALNWMVMLLCRTTCIDGNSRSDAGAGTGTDAGSSAGTGELLVTAA